MIVRSQSQFLPVDASQARTYYTVFEERSSADVVVVDDDTPILTISAVNPSVSESDRAEFKIESNVSPLADTNVNLDITQTRLIIDGSLANYTSVTLHEGRTSANLSIPLIDDNTFQNNAFIRISLDDGSAYRLTDSSTEVEVYVEDNDLLSQVAIQSVTNVIEEGESAEFLISTQPLNFDRTLDVSATKTGDFFTDLELPPVILPANDSNVIISIPTVDDVFDEDDGSIEMVLSDGENYTVAPAYALAVVSIEDDDFGPEISITANSASAAEGESAEFTITTSHTSLTNIAITLQLDDPQGFAERPSNALSATIEAGELSTNLTIPIPNNQDGEQDGSIEVTLLSSSQYFINPEQNSAQMTILDDDLPRISVQPSNYAYEDEEATFALYSTVDVPSELLINYHADVEGNYWTNVSGDFQASFYDNQLGGTPTNQSRLIQIGYNSALQEDGAVTLTINPGTGYNVAMAPENHATIAILDAQTPSIGIYPVRASEPEGNQALYYISTRSTLSEPLLINLAVTSTGDLIAGEIPNTITIFAGDQSALLRINTENDTEFELTGEITVQITDGPGYRPHNRDSSASIAILDDDGPMLSIAADAESIYEDSNASFTITASTPIDTELTIPIAVTEAGEYLLNTEFEPVILPANSTEVQFQVAVEDDTVVELDGSITARILGDDNYSIQVAPNDRATVTLQDNDVPIGISILAMKDSIQEGQLAPFKIQSQSALPETVEIGVEVTSDSSFLTATNPHLVDLVQGEQSCVA